MNLHISRENKEDYCRFHFEFRYAVSQSDFKFQMIFNKECLL